MSEPIDKRTGFSAVVLAAGRSTRMGRNKLFLDIAGRTMIRHAVETVRSVLDDVVVVTGVQPERIAEALARLPVRLVAVDAEQEEGQGASIADGLAAVQPALGTLVCVGDQPRLTGREIDDLISGFLEGPRDRVLVPARGLERGYPLVVPAGWDQAAVDLAAEDLLQAWPDQTRAFPTRNPVYLHSVDTPEDYRGLFRV